MGRKNKRVLEARVDNKSSKRQGCGFTSHDLDRVVQKTGLSRTEVEKGLKTAFRKAKPDGDPITAFNGIFVRKGPRGQTAHIKFG